jgi:hypothetical protein
MIEKRRELPATIDIPWTAKGVAPGRLTAMNANHPEQSAAKAGVAGSSPETRHCRGRRYFDSSKAVSDTHSMRIEVV